MLVSWRKTRQMATLQSVPGLAPAIPVTGHRRDDKRTYSGYTHRHRNNIHIAYDIYVAYRPVKELHNLRIQLSLYDFWCKLLGGDISTSNTRHRKNLLYGSFDRGNQVALLVSRHLVQNVPRIWSRTTYRRFYGLKCEKHDFHILPC